MKVLDFLKQKLSDFISDHTYARVCYEYDEIANLHTIEVLPQSLYDSDEFVMWECAFFKQVSKSFPGTEVCFVSEDSYVGIDHVDWLQEGKDFVEDESTLIYEEKEQNDLSTFLSVEQKNIELSSFESFDTHVHVFESSEIYQLEDKFEDSVILNNKSTLMSFDDNLLQAA